MRLVGCYRPSTFFADGRANKTYVLDREFYDLIINKQLQKRDTDQLTAVRKCHCFKSIRYRYRDDCPPLMCSKKTNLSRTNDYNSFKRVSPIEHRKTRKTRDELLAQ